MRSPEWRKVKEQDPETHLLVRYMLLEGTRELASRPPVNTIQSRRHAAWKERESGGVVDARSLQPPGKLQPDPCHARIVNTGGYEGSYQAQ
ncbi:hypothetical protein E2C01_012660 [Portunus trituberculatus]|uniref:Uncharacterized protein n=1 Tax=Portunus trituberculatus TaxID=210409 RepID=A0A5B7DER0_PORTR|nr:hypothetical protein [Portunus trituberculatus]